MVSCQLPVTSEGCLSPEQSLALGHVGQIFDFGLCPRTSQLQSVREGEACWVPTRTCAGRFFDRAGRSGNALDHSRTIFGLWTQQCWAFFIDRFEVIDTLTKISLISIACINVVLIVDSLAQVCWVQYHSRFCCNSATFTKFVSSVIVLLREISTSPYNSDNTAVQSQQQTSYSYQQRKLHWCVMMPNE